MKHYEITPALIGRFSVLYKDMKRDDALLKFAFQRNAN